MALSKESVVGNPAKNWEFWARFADLDITTAVRWGVPLAWKGETPVQGKAKGNFIQGMEQEEWMEKEVEKMLESRAIKVVEKGEECWISPVHLVPKNGPKKFRLVIDMRELNLFLVLAKCKFEGLGSILRLASKGWWAFSFDLEQGYFHFLMRREDQNWLAFEWKGVTYAYRVMPFGLAVLPLWFTKILRTVIRKWRAQGIFVVAYLDDFIVLASSAEELLRIREEIIKPDLEGFGLVRAPGKGHWEPTQVIDILGLTLDLEGGWVKIPREKVVACRKAIAMVAKGDSMSARALAGVAGKLIAVARAFAPARLFTREFYRIIDAAERNRWQWDDKVTLTEKAMKDARWLLANLDRFNGKAAWKPSRIIVLCLSLTWLGRTWREEKCGTLSWTTS